MTFSVHFDVTQTVIVIYTQTISIFNEGVGDISLRSYHLQIQQYDLPVTVVTWQHQLAEQAAGAGVRRAGPAGGGLRACPWHGGQGGSPSEYSSGRCRQRPYPGRQRAAGR